MDLDCCQPDKAPSFPMPCCSGCCKKYEDPCLRHNLDCKSVLDTYREGERETCSGHLNYLEKKAICCEMQCAHRQEKLTGYKTIPYAMPIPNYMGHRPLHPHPLPIDPREFMGCHTSVCCPHEDVCRD